MTRSVLPSKTLAATLLCGSAIAFVPTQQAYAECVVEGGGEMANAANPESGVTINCENNLDNEGVVNREANDVTVNIVAPAGGISVTAQPGVALGDGATVDVASGSNRPINTSGDSAPGIDVGNDASITVGGQVTTAGGMSGAIRTGDTSTVEISGTVRTGGGMSPAISVGADSTIDLMEGALVATGNSNSPAVEIRGDNSTLNVMTDAEVTTSSGMSNPVLASGNMATINVMGDVRSSSGNATAILLEGDMGAVTVADGGFVTAQSSNSNGIESTGTGASITVENGGEVRISSGNSAAIVSGTEGEVMIAGTVSASSSQSQGVILGDMGTLTLMDMGVIETSSSGSQAVLVSEDAMEATINVDEGGDIDAVGAVAVLSEGMTDVTLNVDGRVFGGASATTIDLGMGDDVVNISETGTIEGTSSDPVIDLGAGMDELTVGNEMGIISGTGGLLADLGEGMDTLSLQGGGEYQSDQFSGAETVNVGEGAGGEGSGGMGGEGGSGEGGMGGSGEGGSGGGVTYTVNDMQMQQTVNVGSGSSASVEMGGSVGTLNSSGMGSSADVNEGGMAENVNSSGMGSEANVNSGGMAENVNASEGGSANVNEGGMAENVNSSGMGSEANVNSGGMAENVNASEGGSANINSGGSAMNTTSGNGGNVTVGSGGDAGRVQSDAGGILTVQSGGAAQVDENSGNGGTLTFEQGSEARTLGEATGRDQSMRIAGVDFQDGVLFRADGSRFFEGEAIGDTVNIRLRRGVFSEEIGLEGIATVNTVAAALGIDQLVEAQGDVEALDRLGAILQTREGDVTGVFDQISQSSSVQLAAASPIAARQFNDMLRAGVNPLTGGGPFASGEVVQVAGPAHAGAYRNNGADGNFGVWAATSFGDTNVDVDGQEELDTQSIGYAGGVEGRIEFGGFDEAAVGVGVGYTYTDVNSAAVSDGDVESWSAGVYAGGTKGAVRTDLALSYTNSVLENSGTVDGVDQLLAESESDALAGRVEIAVDVFGDANQGFNFAPLVRATGITVDYEDFGEAGPIGTQLVDGQFEQGVLGAGGRIGFVTGDVNGGSGVKATIEAAYERVFGDRDVTFGADIANTAGAFDVIQTATDKDRVHVGGTLGVEISDTLDLGVRYDGRFGSDVTDHGASARATLRF